MRAARPAALLLCAATAALGPGLAEARQLPQRPADVAEADCRPGAQPGLIERLLRVTVNGSQTGQDLVLLQRPCGALFARRADLAALRIRVEDVPVVEIDGEPYANLNDYDGLRFELAEARQQLTITGEPRIFRATVLDLSPAPPPPPQAAAPGGFINYGVYGSGAADGATPTATSANAGVGLFAGEWLALGDWLWFRQGEVEQRTRLDSTLLRDFPARVGTLRIGDVFARGGSAGGGVALGGLQYGTNFATRPGMAIGPAQVLDAAVQQAASVELMVRPMDPQRESRAVFLDSLTTVPHGPVELVNVPTYNNGSYELVLRDALGREVLVQQEFFFNSGLLRQGLHDFSYEAGLRRRDFGGDSYGGAALSGLHRYGISNALTGEVQGLWVDGATLAGLTGLAAVPRVGVLSLTGAAAGGGLLAALGIENRYDDYGYALRGECRDADYEDPVAAPAAMSPACRSLAGVSAALPRGASAGLTGGLVTQRGGVTRRSGRLGLSLRPWSGASLHLYAGWTRDEREQVSVGLVFSASLAPLGAGRGVSLAGLDARRAQVGVTATGSDDLAGGRAQGRLSSGGRVGDTTVGVSLGRSLAGPEQQSLTLSAAAPRITGVGGVQSGGGTETWSAGATGAVALVGGRVLPTQPLYSSFALVRLGAENAGVRVNGVRTDDQGDALVAPLQAYAANDLSINGADLPLNARYPAQLPPVAPRWRSGVVLRPQIERVRDAMVTVWLRDAAGGTRPVPPGSWARVGGAAADERFPAGEDGAIYLAGLSAHSRVEVAAGATRCMIEVQLPEAVADDVIPELGPYVCEAQP